MERTRRSDSPGVQYLDPTKGAIKGNIRWVSLACQIVYCAEYDGVSWAPRDANHPRVAERNSSTDSGTPKQTQADWPDGLTDEEIALVMDPEWRRKEALPHFVAESPALGEFLDKRLKAWGF